MPGNRSEMNPKREIFFNKYSNIADAFNRLRVSQPIILFDSSQKYGKRLEQWFERRSSTTVPAIAAQTSNASVQISLDGANQQAYRQSRRYIQYQPGKSHLILLTFAGMESQEVNKKVGYFDAENGIYFKSNRNGYYWVERSYTSGAAVDTPTSQSSWNIDKLDGTGPSKYTLDFSKVQIAIIDMEWLGVGRVRTGFVVDGTIVYAHEFLQANVGTEVYMRTATLPCRYELQSCTALSSSVTMNQICASVMSEGGESLNIGGLRSQGTETNLISLTSQADVAVLTVRPKTTFKGETNRVPISLDAFEVFAESQDVHYHLIYGGTVVSATSTVAWNDVSSTFSAVEYASQANCTVKGGITIDTGYVAASADNKSNYAAATETNLQREFPLTLDPDGAHPTSTADLVTDQVTVVAGTLGADTDVGAVIRWTEGR